MPGVNDCLTTTSPEARITDVSWNRVFTRTEVKLIQPIFDFGKISAGIDAARGGRRGLAPAADGARADLELNVRKAYYGLKFARDVIDMLDEGSSYVDDAQKKLEKDLANGTGNVSVTDKLRMRTVRAELDARILEAKRLQGIARDSLRTLLGTEAPADIDVDDEEFEPPEVKERTVTYYEDLREGEPARGAPARVRGQGQVSARRSGAAQGVPGPRPDRDRRVRVRADRRRSDERVLEPLLQQPLGGHRGGAAHAARPRAQDRARAARPRPRRRRSPTGAARRWAASCWRCARRTRRRTRPRRASTAMDKGQKAGKAWISAVAQNFAVGLAEARDLSDALVAFFGMRTRYLQAVFDLYVARSALTRATGSAEL